MMNNKNNHFPPWHLFCQMTGTVVSIKSPRNVELQAVICALITVSGWCHHPREISPPSPGVVPTLPPPAHCTTSCFHTNGCDVTHMSPREWGRTHRTYATLVPEHPVREQATDFLPKFRPTSRSIKHLRIQNREARQEYQTRGNSYPHRHWSQPNPAVPLSRVFYNHLQASSKVFLKKVTKRSVFAVSPRDAWL